MNRMLAAAMAAMTVSAAAPAMAQSWYGALGVGRTDVDLRADDFNVTRVAADHRDWSYNARIGYDFSRVFGAEIAYADLGKYGYGGDVNGFPVNGEASIRAWSAALVGNLPVSDTLGAYAKVGYARTKVSDGGNSDSGAMYGLGAKWMLDRQWGLFLEWNRYQELKLDNYVLGALIRF
jgi:opacity protein-like surface antigen